MARRCTIAAGAGQGTTIADGAALEMVGSITVAEPLAFIGAGPSQTGVLVSATGGQTLSGAITVQRAGLPVEGIRSKDWNEFTLAGAPPLDFVFTVCDNAANEVCPVWPGQPMTAHWGVPDPSNTEGSDEQKRHAFAETFRILALRIGLFASLPMDKLDRLSIKQKLDEIGKS